MNQDRSTMDCAACGKPLSVTAKFCGKCGAPVKRLAKGSDLDTSLTQPELALAQSSDSAMAVKPESSPAASKADSAEVPASAVHPDEDDLVFQLSPSSNALDDQKLLNIDLNLEPPPGPVADSAASAKADLAWLHRLELHQQELKKTLEKHSLLLDFISLASQQQSHQQAQPDPNEALLHNLIEQQTQFAVQLAELQNHLHAQRESVSTGRIPEEFKLLLEKQKIEIQKSFGQNLAQNTENMATAREAELTKVQDMLKANTIAAEAIEKNLAPLIQSVNDLKLKVQAVVKKVEDAASSKTKSGGKEEPAGEGGGFMIFVIGMLCGLTVVLSTLAIYNFLTHDKVVSDSSAKSLDKITPDSKAKAGH